MNTRRSFLKLLSILGLVTIAESSLMAASHNVVYHQPEALGSTHMDQDFDPDSWL